MPPRAKPTESAEEVSAVMDQLDAQKADKPQVYDAVRVTAIKTNGPTGTILDEITDITLVPTWFKLLIYGDTTVGKTLLSGNFHEIKDLVGEEILYIDCEGGFATIRKIPGIKPFRVRTWAKIEKLYDALWDMCTKPQQWKGPRYKYVVLDSVTDLETIARNEILKTEVKRNPNQDPDAASQGIWGKAAERIRRMIKAFRDLPIHFVCIALEKEDKDGKLRPNVPGKLAPEMAAYFDVVGRMTMAFKPGKDANNKPIQVVHRQIIFAPSPRVTAKDRFGVLPPVMNDPTLAKIVRPILSGMMTLDETDEEDTTVSSLEELAEDTDEDKETDSGNEDNQKD